MTTPLDNTVTLTDPAEVLAAVPHLLGFHPSDSLVLITMHETTRGLDFGLTVRMDLPLPEQRYELAEYLLRGPLAGHGADAVMLVVVGSQTHGQEQGKAEGGHGEVSPDRESTADSEGWPPHRQLIEVLREVLGGAGIAVVHASWTPFVREGSEWRCYGEDDCFGQIPDPTASPLAAAMTAAGAVTFDSREDLEQLVAAESAESIARRAARLDALYEDTEQERASEDSAQRDLRTVFTAIRRTSQGSAMTEDDLLRVLIALSDNRVRDSALSTALGEWALAAEQLWITLVRKAPSPELADVAALLAFSAYLRGDGALAGVALERIEATRPEHRLGCLLRQTLTAGIPPDDLAVIARDAAEDARTLIEEDGPWA